MRPPQTKLFQMDSTEIVLFIKNNLQIIISYLPQFN